MGNGLSMHPHPNPPAFHGEALPHLDRCPIAGEGAVWRYAGAMGADTRHKDDRRAHAATWPPRPRSGRGRGVRANDLSMHPHPNPPAFHGEELPRLDRCPSAGEHPCRAVRASKLRSRTLTPALPLSTARHCLTSIAALPRERGRVAAVRRGCNASLASGRTAQTWPPRPRSGRGRGVRGDDLSMHPHPNPPPHAGEGAGWCRAGACTPRAGAASKPQPRGPSFKPPVASFSGDGGHRGSASLEPRLALFGERFHALARIAGMHGDHVQLVLVVQSLLQRR